MSRSSTPADKSTTITDGLPFDDVTPATIRVLADCGVLSDQSSDSEFSPNSAFELLAHPGRRVVLTYLLSAGPMVTLTQLLDYVFEQSDTGSHSPATRQEVTEAFTTTHLPKLDAEGYLLYDLEQQRITTTDQTTKIKPYLVLAMVQQRTDENTRIWH